MTLTAGTRLGPYEILAPIGAGAMGEVYRAADLRRGRNVAVKVLPEALPSDPDRLSRFEREAMFYAEARESDRAIHWLKKACIEGEPQVIALGFNPHWDGLRSDPRFEDMVRRTRLPPIH